MLAHIVACLVMLRPPGFRYAPAPSPPFCARGRSPRVSKAQLTLGPSALGVRRGLAPRGPDRWPRGPAALDSPRLGGLVWRRFRKGRCRRARCLEGLGEVSAVFVCFAFPSTWDQKSTCAWSIIWGSRLGVLAFMGFAPLRREPRDYISPSVLGTWWMPSRAVLERALEAVL